MLDRRAVNESRFSCASVRAHTFQVLMQNLACFNRGEHAQLQETFFFFYHCSLVNVEINARRETLRLKMQRCCGSAESNRRLAILHRRARCVKVQL